MRTVTIQLPENKEQKQRNKEQSLESERLEAENRLEEIIEEQLVGKNEKSRLDFIHTFALVMDEYGGLDSYINFLMRNNKNKTRRINVDPINNRVNNRVNNGVNNGVNNRVNNRVNSSLSEQANSPVPLPANGVNVNSRRSRRERRRASRRASRESVERPEIRSSGRVLSRRAINRRRWVPGEGSSF